MSKNICAIPFKSNLRRLNQVIQLVFLLSYDRLIQPFFLAAAEDNYTIFLQFHDLFGMLKKLLQFYFCDLTFKNAVLYPVEILPAQFKHFAHTFFFNIVNKDDVHGID